jgi:hypothetical protein
MQCSATGVLPGGGAVNLTSLVTWFAANSGPCTAAAGTISATGVFTAVTAGCKSAIHATYTPGGATSTSNTVTVTVVN